MIRNNCGFDYSAEGDGLAVTIGGEIDHHGAAPLRDGIDALIWAHRPKHLYIDMSGVEFMDSSGLGLIMGRYELMRELGGDVTVRDPAPCVDRMLKLTGFDRRVKIELSARPARRPRDGR